MGLISEYSMFNPNRPPTEQQELQMRRASGASPSFPFAMGAPVPPSPQRFYSQQMPPFASQSSHSTPAQSPVQMGPRRGGGGGGYAMQPPSSPMYQQSEYGFPIQQLYPFQPSNPRGEWFGDMAPGEGGGRHHHSQSQPDLQRPAPAAAAPTPTPTSTAGARGAQGGGGGNGRVSLAGDGAGDAPVPQPGTNEPQDPGQALVRRMRCGIQELAALRSQRERLQREVAKALSAQNDAQARSEQLDELVAREHNALARAQEREAASDHELAAAHEEAARLRAYLQMQLQLHARQVDSYSTEMTRMVEVARAAPEVNESDHLKRVLDELKSEQLEINTELTDIERDLSLLKDQYAAMMEQGKTFEICSERNLPDALQLLVDDMEKHLDEGEVEGKLLEEELKSLETQKASLAQDVRKLRERPLRTLAPRAAASMSSATSTRASSGGAASHKAYLYQKKRMCE